MPIYNQLPMSRRKQIVRLLLFVVVVVLVVGAVRYWAFTNAPQYRSSALVFVKPFNSAISSDSFQSRAFQSLPDVHLKKRGDVIEVVALAPTEKEAQIKAEEGTILLHRAVLETFGETISVSTIRRANAGKRVSLFHDMIYGR